MSSRAKGKQEGTQHTGTTDLTLLENFYLFIYVCNNLPFLVPLPEFTYVPCVARQSRENGCIECEREPEAVTGEINYINSHRNTQRLGDISNAFRIQRRCKALEVH